MSLVSRGPEFQMVLLEKADSPIILCLRGVLQSAPVATLAKAQRIH